MEEKELERFLTFQRGSLPLFETWELPRKISGSLVSNIFEFESEY